MRITVFGATGGVGQEVVRQAVAAGHEVTAVVRDPARLPVPLSDVQVHTVARVDDPEALREAVAGRDAVLSALGSHGRKADGVAERLTGAVLAAMEAEGCGGCWWSARPRSAPGRPTTRCRTGWPAR